MKKKLTELLVTRMRPPATGRLEVWDENLPAFGVRITAAGARSYVVALRKPGAKHPSRIKVGTPGRMTLAEARTKAQELMADPHAVAARSAPTFETLALSFLAHGRTKRGRVLRPGTVREYRRALLGYAKPLHGKPVAAIRRADVAQVIRDVASSSGATTAMRTRAALSRLFSWCVANGHIEANVVTGTEGYDLGKRSRVLTDGELAALWAATEARSDFNLIIRLCLWTGARRSEVGGMMWSELDGGVWRLPGDRTKNHRALALPLPHQALTALDSWHRYVGRDHIFGRSANGFCSWSRSKWRLDVRLGFANSWNLHDLRRTVANSAALSRDQSRPR